MSLINCKECGKEMSDQAGSCPNCGCPVAPVSNNQPSPLPETKRKRSPGCLIAVLVFVVFIIMVIGGSIIFTHQFSNNMQKQVSGVSDVEEYITLDDYNAITTDMTYEDVVSLIGNNGIESSRVEANGYQIVIVTWYGNGMAGSNANVTFTNGMVSGKAQVGLLPSSGETSTYAPSADPTAEPSTEPDISTITIPFIYFYEKTEVFAYYMELSNMNTHINEDNSLTVTMTNIDKEEFLFNFGGRIAENIDDFKKKYPMCSEFSVSDNYSSIDVCSSNKNPPEDFIPELFNIMRDCLKYQIVKNETAENVDLILSIYSADREKLYSSESWQYILEQAENKTAEEKKTPEKPSQQSQSTPSASDSGENIVYSNDISPDTQIVDRTAFANMP